jgi:phage/plasmid-associated DNA primase
VAETAPLIRSGTPGARGWMTGDGTFLLGPYQGTKMLDWALAYARQGWHVFQMRPGTKGFFSNCTQCKPSHDHYDAAAHPDTSTCTLHPDGYARCHGLWGSTRDEQVIRHWWTENPHGNIGINCGLSGIACVDVDIKHAQGKFGDQSMAALEQMYGDFPEGPRAVTASGGWHWLFELPEGHELRSSTGWTDHKGKKHGLADWVDIKAVGGLMVAAPSLVFDSSTGRVTGQYQWTHDDDTSVPALPGWVVGAIQAREKREAARPAPVPFADRADADRDEVLARVHELADEVANAPAGGRNSLLLVNAGKCFQYAEAGQIPHHEVQFIFEQAAVASGLDASDMRTITNARNRAVGKPRPWTARTTPANIPWPRVAPAPAPAPAAAPVTDDLAVQADVAVIDTDDQSHAAPAVLPSGTNGGTGDDGPAVDQTFLDEVREYQPDHLGQARYFCDIDGAKLILRWNMSAGAFMKYDLDRGHWRQDDGKHTLTASELTRLGIKINDATDREIKYSPEMEIIRQSYKGGVKKEEVARAKKIIEMKRMWPKLYGSAAGAGGILTFTRTLVNQCTALDFETKPELLNFTNGTYDVKTGQLRTHSMDDMLTHQVAHALDMGLAEKPLEEVAPHFHKLITRMCAAPGEVTPDVHEKRVAAVLRLLGYSLHGSNPEKKMAALVGGTNIGKNQAVEVVGQLLGNQLAWLGARPQLLIEGKGERHDSDEYGLAGRRMVLVNEMQEGQVLDEGQVLRFVGSDGGQVALRRMRQDREDHWITWKLLVTTNELPRTRMTPQILGRLNIYQLSEIPVPAEEQYNIKKAILDSEGPAVLAHLVKEWRAWYAAYGEANSPTGLLVSDDMTEAKENYRASNLPLALEFMGEVAEKGDGIPLTQASEFWSRFQQWLKEEHPNLKRDEWPGRNAFYADLRTLDGKDGVEVVMENKGGGRMQFRGLRGVRLIPLSVSEMQRRYGGH